MFDASIPLIYYYNIRSLLFFSAECNRVVSDTFGEIESGGVLGFWLGTDFDKHPICKPEEMQKCYPFVL